MSDETGLPTGQKSGEISLMSAKLCPFRKTFGEKYEEHEIEIDGIGKLDSIRGEIFGFCLLDRCAMWRECSDWPREEGSPMVGYCGLAGKI
jgi:hypothetical protein